jgi:long-chain acyl-CoA synthetase
MPKNSVVLNYPFENFYEMIVSNAQQKATQKIILIDDEKISNLEFLHQVDTFASYLQHIGVSQGDKVALIAPNSSEFLISVYATTKLGAVVVPINTLLKANEYQYILNDANAKVLITSNKYSKEVSNLHHETPIENIVWIDSDKDVNNDSIELNKNSILFSHAMEFNRSEVIAIQKSSLDDLAIIFYTSGTTGQPKGAMLSYRNIFSNMIAGSERFDVTHKDRFIVYLPMFHAFTFSVMCMLPFYTNSSLVVIRNLMPFSNIIKQTLLKRVTVFLGVPDIYNALIRAKLPWYFLWFNSIRVFISGASALSEDTQEKFSKIFKRATMIEGYGLSECSPAVCCNLMNKQKLLSVGIPLKSYQMKIVDDELMEVPRGDVGEIIVKGDCVMLGYLNNDEATNKTIINGWLKTGDLAKMDEEGFVYIVDRIKDLIISKGVNIYPRQIEEELNKLEFIKDSAVISQNDIHSGEVPIAFIELEDDVDNSLISEHSIKKKLKKNLANFKIPKTITILDELPKNATGKCLKRVLKEEYK